MPNCPTRDMSLFDEDREWLGCQPGMKFWEPGCQKLLDTMEQWAREYLGQVSDPKMGSAGSTGGGGSNGAGQARLMPYVARLWACWRHHWQDAYQSNGQRPVSGEAVARRIQSGWGYRGGKQLGGNPLRDVVFAEAVVGNFGEAVERFQREYKEQVLNWCRDGIDGAEEEEFWQDLFTELAVGAQPKLNSFRGKCGLTRWLKVVAKREAIRFLESKDKQVKTVALPGEGPSGGGDPANEAEMNELVQKFQDWLDRNAREHPEMAVAIRLVADGATQQEAAKVVGVHAGTVSRWLEEMRRAVFGLGDS